MQRDKDGSSGQSEYEKGRADQSGRVATRQ